MDRDLIATVVVAVVGSAAGIVLAAAQRRKLDAERRQIEDEIDRALRRELTERDGLIRRLYDEINLMWHYILNEWLRNHPTDPPPTRDQFRPADDD